MDLGSIDLRRGAVPPPLPRVDMRTEVRAAGRKLGILGQLFILTGRRVDSGATSGERREGLRRDLTATLSAVEALRDDLRLALDRLSLLDALGYASLADAFGAWEVLTDDQRAVLLGVMPLATALDVPSV